MTIFSFKIYLYRAGKIFLFIIEIEIKVRFLFSSIFHTFSECFFVTDVSQVDRLCVKLPQGLRENKLRYSFEYKGIFVLYLFFILSKTLGTLFGKDQITYFKTLLQKVNIENKCEKQKIEEKKYVSQDLQALVFTLVKNKSIVHKMAGPQPRVLGLHVLGLHVLRQRILG